MSKLCTRATLFFSIVASLLLLLFGSFTLEPNNMSNILTASTIFAAADTESTAQEGQRTFFPIVLANSDNPSISATLTQAATSTPSATSTQAATPTPNATSTPTLVPTNSSTPTLAPTNTPLSTNTPEPIPTPIQSLLGSIGGLLFHDEDADGIFNEENGDSPLPRVVVDLLDESGNVVGILVSQLDGRYQFTELPIDQTYKVVVYSPTLPATSNPNAATDPDGGADGVSEVTLAQANPENLTQNFGYAPLLGQIGGAIYHEDNADGRFAPSDGDFPIAAVSVSLIDESGAVLAESVTDSDGHYIFEDLPLNVLYTVIVDAATLPNGYMNFPFTPPNVDIGDDTVTLTPEMPDVLDWDYGFEPILGSIRGMTFYDVNGDAIMEPDDGDFPLLEVLIALTDDSGALIDSAITDLDGGYIFNNLPIFNVYHITVDTSTLPSGMNPTPTSDPDGDLDSTSQVTLTDDTPDISGQDFGYAQAQEGLGRIGGMIYHENNADWAYDPADGDFPLEGVSVWLLDDSGMAIVEVATDPDGRYLFEDLPYNVMYTVEVDPNTLPAGYDTLPFIPPDVDIGDDTITLTPEMPNVLDQDFGFEQIPSN